MRTRVGAISPSTSDSARDTDGPAALTRTRARSSTPPDKVSDQRPPSGRAASQRVRGRIEDDHTPFVAAGLPAIDLIDFDYPGFHTRRDNLGAVSQRSLDAAGEALVELVRRERAR